MKKSPVRRADTRYGQLAHFEFDDPIGRSLELYGEWAQAEIDFLSRFIHAGDCVVDVGANIGTHTIAFAKLVGTEGRVIAIEPQPEVFQLLEENVRANGLRQVERWSFAVSDAIGIGQLSLPDYSRRHNSGTASLGAGGGGGVAVELKPIDALELPSCAVLKMDIEGWEDRALKGAVRTLTRCQPVVYAECNSIDAGWHMLQAAGPDFVAFLHAPAAFNEENHQRVPLNIFGGAQETNLLLVPRSRLEGLRADLAAVPHLDAIQSLDDLSQAFLRAGRYGEKVVSPQRTLALARRLEKSERELCALRACRPAPAPPPQALPPEPARLTKPLTVIIPIYNGFDDFQRLVESLFGAYRVPDPLLTFVFIDDASPDPRIGVFLGDPVFDRTDVVRLTNVKNRGFIGTVNRGLEMYCLGDGGSDVVLLNTDTLIFGNVLAILQRVARTLPNVASVTPWSNNATIASILNWPHGGDLFAAMEPEEVSRVVETAAIPTRAIAAPTGVGFCMYMTREAVLVVGGLDPIYGKGYGEENHWCQTAARQGFLNVLCTEAFVYHRGSVSFGDETKRRQLEKNMRMLEEAHPAYHRDVAEYLRADPLRGERAQVLWAIRRHYRRVMGLHTTLYLLHSDPFYFGGGTEKHVMGLTEHLLTSGGAEVLHLFPTGAAGEYVLRVFMPRGVSDVQESALLSARFSEDDLYELLCALAPEVDTFHVHHFLGWPRWLTRAIPLFAHARRIVTLHDYYAVCPSIRLLGRHGYCGLPTNLVDCNECLHSVHGVSDVRIEDWRTANAHFLGDFDLVLTPSEAARKTLIRGFGSVAAPGQGSLGSRIVQAVKVVPNFVLDMPHELPAVRPGPAGSPSRVVFLGAFSEPKGARLVELTSEEAAGRGWSYEVWGAIGARLPAGVVHRTYTNSRELRALGAEFPVDVVVLPATWPETFSFTTYEAALDLRAPVVVGPYGNPPSVVAQFGIGVVLRELTAEAFLEAVSSALSRRGELVERLEAFEQHARGLTIDDYVRHVYSVLDVRSSVQGAALRALPTPTNTPRQVDVPSREVALRHLLADRANLFVKTHAPAVHAYGRRFGGWIFNKVKLDYR